MQLRLFGGRLEVCFGEEKRVFSFRETSAFTVLGRNKLNAYFEGKVFQFKGDKHFNAVKYVQLFYRFQNLLKGDEHGKFLGL